MLKFFVNSSFLILMHIGLHYCLNFEADSETEKGSNVKLVCSIDPARFNAAVSVLKDGNSKTTCDNGNNCLPQTSDSNHYKYFSNASAVTVEIQSLDHSLDSGIWKCKLGLIEEKDFDLVVKTFPGFTEFTQTIPDSNSSQLVKNVKLSGRCYCIFPPPSVKLYFREGTNGAFQFHQEISDSFINKRNETSLCAPYEFDVEVSNFTVEMSGKTNVFFEMHFDDHKAAAVGPFSFAIKAGCKYSDVELFLGGFSCFLIVLITSIIMLILLFCNKRFGDKKTNKITIIVVFNSFALIIGFAQGFALKECDKRDLGLGLGLGFGFILAIALVLTLYIYHKLCGSKKENEDENRFSLDSCFRKCQVKPEKEIKKPEDHTQRVGSPASASNIKMESKNKTDVLKGDQSALKQKVLHSPLPLPPVDNSQPSKASDDKLSRKKLDPIAVENEEANSSEKKKKKKKRKKKKIDNETADNNVEEAGDNGNLN